MGDFNMSLLALREELHSRGVHLQLLAWYPWRNSSGNTMLDSLGIFSVNIHVSIRLYHDLRNFDDDGNLINAEIEAAVVAATGVHFVHKRVDSYEGIAAPPRKSLTCYMPKLKDCRGRIETALQPAYNATELEKFMSLQKGFAASMPRPMKEKRLSDTDFVYDGQAYGDAHFPVVAYTDYKSRRSDEAHQRRNKTS